MTINSDVFRSILAMDSYNRGYDAGINLTGSSLGDAVLWKDSTQEPGLPSSQAISFFAQAYSWNGETVISYRGTNSPGMLDDISNGWPTGFGWADAPQAMLALKFYNAVDAATDTNIELTDHSLGGGLAGYVGSLMGEKVVIFDNMTFEAAATKAYQRATYYYDPGNYDDQFPAYDQQLYETIYKDEAPWAIDGSRVTGYAVSGEILAATRGLQQTPV